MDPKSVTRLCGKCRQTQQSSTLQAHWYSQGDVCTLERLANRVGIVRPDVDLDDVDATVGQGLCRGFGRIASQCANTVLAARGCELRCDGAALVAGGTDDDDERCCAVLGDSHGEGWMYSVGLDSEVFIPTIAEAIVITQHTVSPPRENGDAFAPLENGDTYVCRQR